VRLNVYASELASRLRTPVLIDTYRQSATLDGWRRDVSSRIQSFNSGRFPASSSSY
jgi:hypothetical protein